MDAAELMLMHVNLFLLAHVGWQRGWRGVTWGWQPSCDHPHDSSIRAASWTTACHCPLSHHPAALGLGDTPALRRGGTRILPADRGAELPRQTRSHLINKG